MANEINRDKVITLIDSNGEEIEAEVLLFFELKEFNKNYLVYTHDEKDKNEMITVYASTYVKEDGKIYLNNIETEEEWDAVKNVMREVIKNGDMNNMSANYELKNLEIESNPIQVGSKPIKLKMSFVDPIRNNAQKYEIIKLEQIIEKNDDNISSALDNEAQQTISLSENTEMPIELNNSLEVKNDDNEIYEAKISQLKDVKDEYNGNIVLPDSSAFDSNSIDEVKENVQNDDIDTKEDSSYYDRLKESVKTQIAELLEKEKKENEEEEDIIPVVEKTEIIEEKEETPVIEEKEETPVIEEKETSNYTTIIIQRP